MSQMEEKGKFLASLTAEEKSVEDGKQKTQEYLEKSVLFCCAVCALEEKCHYLGSKPKFVKNLVQFKEEAYLMIDPFSPCEPRMAKNFLLLGADCSKCAQPVCLDCSIFYIRRFCVTCANFYCEEFPEEVRPRIRKLAEQVRQAAEEVGDKR